MARVPYLSSRDDVPESARSLYDHIGETRGAMEPDGAMPHSFQALFNSPGAAEVIGGLGEYIRFESALDPVIRETAILATAKELNSQYEWTHHEPVARKVGVRDEVIEAILSGRAPMGLPPKEGVFTQVPKELVRKGVLSERTYQAVDHLIGPQNTVDLIVTVSYFIMLAMTLGSLGVELEPGLTPLMPEE